MDTTSNGNIRTDLHRRLEIGVTRDEQNFVISSLTSKFDYLTSFLYEHLKIDVTIVG